MSLSESYLVEAAQELRNRRRARNHLLDFTCYTYPDYAGNWHHQLICSYLDRFVAGEITRLMIFAPPRSGKSELVSRRLPAFILGKRPDTTIIATSYGADLEVFVEKRFGKSFVIRLTGSNLLDAKKEETFNKFDTLADQRTRAFAEYELESEKAGPVFQLVTRLAF